MAKINFNYNNPLPDQYEALMPDGLSPIEQFEWRKHKLGELRMNGLAVIDEAGNVTFLQQGREQEREERETVSEQSLETSIAGNNDAVVSEKKSRIEAKPKPERRSTVSVPKASDAGYEDIRSVPKSVLQAIRRQFPETASKADLISAAAYIFTNGDCEISDRAMEIVKSYRSDDALTTISERLAHLERENKRHLELLQSIELCTCFNTFDRRYGSNEPRRGPKYTEFREQDNLDMLERLREQAKDQIRTDDLTIGRQIYNQVKDIND